MHFCTPARFLRIASENAPGTVGAMFHLPDWQIHNTKREGTQNNNDNNKKK